MYLLELTLSACREELDAWMVFLPSRFCWLGSQPSKVSLVSFETRAGEVTLSDSLVCMTAGTSTVLMFPS